MTLAGLKDFALEVLVGKRHYPLQVENWGADTYIVGSKGHHDLDEFMAQVRKDFDWPLGMPEHIYLKAVPGRDGTEYRLATKNTRGAFPATQAVEQYGEYRYEAIRAREQGVERQAQ
ncbi:hypothetical protein [Ferrimonas marina]|uniref:Uncharacterized protein n=1 Tax=Ferrimonas marina TaxID=299255 RepID=A0A1M5TVV9_9GAMM|nr:hypothetical protein [Ferrimonas marina]SHH54760.1 hypothetical protein SAMN02745129_2294 [Ferrimonas marina]